MRNCSVNKIFIEKFEFINSVAKDLQLIDLNHSLASPDQDGLFVDTVCFNTEETRQYLYLLKPVKQSFRIDNSIQHRLGAVQVTWRNYMGDLGQCELDHVKTAGTPQNASRQEAKGKDIQVDLVE